MEKRLTIIVPLFGREQFTYRFLNFFRTSNLNYKILLADGLEDGFLNTLLQEYNDLDISSIVLKQESFKDYFSMILNALNSVSSEYVMLADNDDFLLPSSIDMMIDFLDQNLNYSNAGGEIVQFQIDNFSLHPFGKKVFFSNRYTYKRTDEPSNDLYQNIESIFLDFQPNFYNVFRTKTLKKIWEELCSINFSDGVVAEFYISLRAISLGRQKTFLNSPHYLRQEGTGASEKYDFFKSLTAKDLPQDIRKLSSNLSSLMGLDDEEIIINYYQRYLKEFVSKRLGPDRRLQFRFQIQAYLSIDFILYLIFYIKDYLLIRRLKMSSRGKHQILFKELNNVRLFLKTFLD